MTRRRLLLCAAALVLLAAASYAVLPGSGQAIAYLLPPLVMLVALAARWYPGERVLVRLMAGKRARRRDSAMDECRPQPRARVPRGGRLIACSLAVRPPPPACLSS